MSIQTETLTMDREEASRLYREYRDHRQYSDQVDRDIARTYRMIAQGKVVIRALESIRVAGLGEDGLPKLAIVRADATSCFLHTMSEGRARMTAREYVRVAETRSYFDFPAGTFPTLPYRWKSYEAMTPLIPVKHRPRKALDQYHILFEAEWRKVVPKDPMLLRRIGAGDMWVVVAAWDLTDVERAALAIRLNG